MLECVYLNPGGNDLHSRDLMNSNISSFNNFAQCTLIGMFFFFFFFNIYTGHYTQAYLFIYIYLQLHIYVYNIYEYTAFLNIRPAAMAAEQRYLANFLLYLYLQ